MIRVLTYTLSDWPEDRLPTCSACRQEVDNGQEYHIPDGSIRFLCSPCLKAIQDIVEAPPDLLTVVVADAAEPTVTTRPARTPRPPRPTGRRTYECAYPPCTNTFQRRQGAGNQRQYCSHQCSTDYRKSLGDAARKAREKHCPNCGKVFIPTLHGKRGEQKYCSLSCSGENRTQLEPRVCSPCGRTFTPDRSTKVYCSQSCHAAGLRGRSNPRPPTLRWARKYDSCIDCGTTKRRHMGNGRCSRCYYPPNLWDRETPDPLPESTSLSGEGSL